MMNGQKVTLFCRKNNGLEPKKREIFAQQDVTKMSKKGRRTKAVKIPHGIAVGPHWNDQDLKRVNLDRLLNQI